MFQGKILYEVGRLENPRPEAKKANPLKRIIKGPYKLICRDSVGEFFPWFIETNRSTWQPRSWQSIHRWGATVWEELHPQSLTAKAPENRWEWKTILSFNGFWYLFRGELLNYVVVSKVFYFHPYLGKISNLTIIFFRWVGSTTNP